MLDLYHFVLVCRDPSSRLSRIKTLINEAERDLYRLRENFTSQNATSGVKDAEKKYKRGERRLQLYRLMQQNFEKAGGSAWFSRVIVGSYYKYFHACRCSWFSYKCPATCHIQQVPDGNLL